MTTGSVTALGGPAGSTGEYELVRLLGRGGSGSVFEARHTTLDRRVAVKVVSAALAEDPEVLQRFVAEARAVNAIRNRGIVDIFAYGRLEDGSPYLVMELLEGTTFARLIESQAPLPVSQVITLASQTLEVLVSAHAAGIVHRDIKPSNLFLATQDAGRPYVKVLDFGLAKTLAGVSLGVDPTREGAMLGTPAYMCPEQIDGTAVTPVSDVYAFGLVLFELLTGAEAVSGTTIVDVLRAQLQAPVPPPSSLQAGVPRALDELVLAMVSKAPEARPSAAEALARLRSIAEALGLAWPPDELPEPRPWSLGAAGSAGGPAPWPRLLTPSLVEGAGGGAPGGPSVETLSLAGAGEAPSTAPPAEGCAPASTQAPAAPGLSSPASAAPGSRLRPALVALGAAVMALAGLLLGFGVGRGAAGPTVEAPDDVAAAGVAFTMTRPNPGRAASDASVPWLAALARDVRGDGGIHVTIDAPSAPTEAGVAVSMGVLSGVELIQGIAAAPDGIARVELLVDGVPYGVIPSGGASYVVERASPEKQLGTNYREATFSYYGVLLNFAELEPGLRRVTVRATDLHGRQGEMVRPAEVQRLHLACVPQAELLRLERARVRGQGPRLSLEGVQLRGVPYDVELSYSDDLQDFRVDRVLQRGDAPLDASDCPSPSALPGYAFRAPAGLPPEAPPGGPTLAADDTLLGGPRRGVFALPGWFAVTSADEDAARAAAAKAQKPFRLLGVRFSPHRYSQHEVVERTFVVPTTEAWGDERALHAQDGGVVVRSFLASVRGEQLPPGKHTMELRPLSALQLPPLPSVPFQVEHFGVHRRVRPRDIELGGARFTGKPGRLFVAGAIVKGERYDLELSFLPSVQRFAITSIRPTAR